MLKIHDKETVRKGSICQLLGGTPRGKHFAESERLGDWLSLSKMRDFGRVPQIQDIRAYNV